MADRTRRGGERDSERDSERDLDSREIDRLAREAPKSEWQERTAPAAGDPMTDDERRAHDIVAQPDPRGDGSIAGVSDDAGGP